MELYFIRHGESENNRIEFTEQYTEHRKIEPDLTGKGIRQAQRLSEFLSDTNPAGNDTVKYDGYNLHGFEFTAIYCSPQLRAARTAAVLSERLGLPVTLWTDIHEYGGVVSYGTEPGEYVGEPGWSRAMYEREFPGLQLPDELGETGWWNRRPLESYDQCSTRADKVYEELMIRHGTARDRVVLVSHCMFYVFLVSRLLGLEFTKKNWFALQNAALSRVDINETGIVIQYHNRFDYLVPDLVT